MIDFSKLPRLNFDVFGAGHLPTQSELMGLISRFPTPENREKFISAHDWAMKCIVYSWQLPDVKQQWELIEALCAHTGHQSAMVQVSFMRMSYYRFLFGRTIVNVRTVSNLVNDSFLSSGVNRLNERLESDILWLAREFPEFKRAFILTESFKISTAALAQDGDIVTLALQEKLRILNQETTQQDALTIRKHYVNSESFETSVCDYCGVFFRVRSGRGVSVIPDHCEADLCERASKAKRAKDYRILNSSGWVVSFDGKRRRCNLCKAIRQVNSDRICKRCFSEPEP